MESFAEFKNRFESQQTKDPTPDVASVKRIRPDGGEAAQSSIFSYAGDAFPYVNPDDLVGSKGIRIYRQMYERDPEIASSHEEIIFGVVSQSWKINCDNDEQREFVENNLKYLGGKTRAGLVYQPLQNLLFELALLPMRDGVGVWEKIWQVYDGKVWLDSLKSKPAEDFEFNADQYGNLTGITFTANTRETFNPDKFLVFPWLNVFQNWYGSSRYRRLYGCFWLSEIVLRMAGQYAEKRSGGIWTGKYPEGNIAAGNQLLAILRKAQASGVAVFPNDLEVDLDNAAHQGGDFFWNFHDLLKKRIRRGMIGLETTAGAGDTGDKAGQESRNKSVKQPLVSFCSQLTQQVLNSVIRQTVEYNWGEQDEYPEFVWDISDPIDSKGAAETAVMLSNIGATIPLEELEAKTGWRLTAKDGEAVVRAIPGAPSLPDGIRNQMQSTGIGTEFAERKPFKRLFSKNHTLAGWDKIDSQWQPQITRYIKQQLNWIKSQIDSHYDDWKTKRSGFLDLNLPYKGAIENLFVKVSRAYQEYGKLTAISEIAHAQVYMGKHFSEAGVNYELPADYYIFPGKYWGSEFTGAMQHEMAAQFQAGFAAGESQQQMKARFEKAWEKFGGSGKEPQWYDFERYYRNAASTTFNDARWEAANKNRNVVVGVEQIAVMDDRTAKLDASLNGSKWALSDPRTSIYKPPLHHRCRCMQDFIYAFEAPKEWSTYPDELPAEGFGGRKAA